MAKEKTVKRRLFSAHNEEDQFKKQKVNNSWC